MSPQIIYHGADVAVPSMNRETGERWLMYCMHGVMGGEVMSKR